MNKTDTLKRIKALGIYPKKSLGQHFLINPSISEKIVSLAKKRKVPRFIEIGPGAGCLTELFIQEKAPLYLIEKDLKISSYWKNRGLNVFSSDVLKLTEKEQTFIFKKNSCVVSNLPYQIASRFIVQCSTELFSVSSMVLMIQKEPSLRILSDPKKKSFGFLSVITQLSWECELAFEVSSEDFYPPPKICSCVLVFRRKPQKLSLEFKNFVKQCFFHKRKKLVKNLALDSKPLAFSVLKEMGVSSKVRAEELYPEQFLKLYESLYKKTPLL